MSHSGADSPDHPAQHTHSPRVLPWPSKGEENGEIRNERIWEVWVFSTDCIKESKMFSKNLFKACFHKQSLCDFSRGSGSMVDTTLVSNGNDKTVNTVNHLNQHYKIALWWRFLLLEILMKKELKVQLTVWAGFVKFLFHSVERNGHLGKAIQLTLGNQFKIGLYTLWGLFLLTVGPRCSAWLLVKEKN